MTTSEFPDMLKLESQVRLPNGTLGFSLIELAIVVFIVALLLGSILVPLHTQVEQRQVSETQKMLEDIREALIGHAVAKGYLPCPDKTSGATTGPNDTPNDGVEDFAAGLCIGTVGGSAGPPDRRYAVGNVPWVTLGLGATDPWGNRFRYVVDLEFASRSPATVFNLATSADIVVCTTATCAVTLTRPISPGVPGDAALAVILSHGKNGYGAIDAAMATQRPLPTSADEIHNLDGNTYGSRTITPLGAAAGEFDDIVTWLGKYTLFNRMVAAGKLP
jgi:type II secretory pathway pseudopilin PulG